MQYKISAMDVYTAREIIRWRYDPPYSHYNIEDETELDSMLDGYHFAVRASADELIGFFCFGLSAQVPSGRARGIYRGRRVLDIGLGMRPDLTGRGFGQSFVQAGIDFATTRWRPRSLRLTVATDNPRAIIVYERLGFRSIDNVTAATNGGQQEYLIMSLKLRKPSWLN